MKRISRYLTIAAVGIFLATMNAAAASPATGMVTKPLPLSSGGHVTAADAAGIRGTAVLPGNFNPPVGASGIFVPELAVYDRTMQQFMDDRNITAGALAVMRDGVLLLERGYGWKDQTLQTPLPENALFRLMSIIKPVTAAAIKNLARQGVLNTGDSVFCLPGSQSSCHLSLTPFGTPDVRLKDVTIQHLLDHTGGWDRAISGDAFAGDPMFQSIAIAGELGVASPPSQTDTVRYMMGRALDYTPGATYAYSNFGYLLLGMITEQVTGQDYATYIQDTIFNPAGVADTEIELGRSLPQYRNPREPWYSCTSTSPNVFNPSQLVPWPDGGWYLEAMEAHGGMIGTTRAMAEFLDDYWISGDPRSGNGQLSWHYGILQGTFTLAYQRPDGVNLVALFNNFEESSELSYYVIKDMLDAATDSVTNWHPAPALGAVGNKNVRERQPLAFTLTAMGSALTYSSTALPTGAILNAATGAFSWTPGGDQAGSHPITFTVTDLGTNQSDSETIAVTVADAVQKNDFDNDGRTDIACYFPPGGNWYGFNSGNGFWQSQFGYAGTLPISGDFDGDGTSDIGCYHPDSGNWYVMKSAEGFAAFQFGYAGTIPVVGDFDGDGKDDIGCYYPPGGNWYLIQSTGGFAAFQFGYAGTIPIVGDFDGDGKDDIGCYYPPGGNWYVMQSTTGFWQTQFGYAGTIPVVGDFDGDGQDDIGCYYPPGGNWYLMQSATGFWQTQFGYTGTEPVVGDFDGDGKSDLGCYYPSGGNWYVMKSAEGFWQGQFGFSGTIPLGGTLR